jgi:hypothetical protein
MGLPSRRAAKKPLLTEAMKLKRLAFAKKYRSWTASEWRNVMYSDESTFSLVNSRSVTVRRGKQMNRYKHRFVVKTVKHSASVMVWACFSGKKGRGGLYFLPKNCTILEYQNFKLKNRPPPPLSPSPKKASKNGEFFSNAYLTI